MDKEKTFISTNLKFLRKTCNKTLVEIGKVCGKRDVAIHYWENGTREPSAIDIAKLCNYFKIPMEMFLNVDIRLNNNIISNSNELNFEKYKHILTESDWNIINTIIEQRKKEVEKEHGNI